MNWYWGRDLKLGGDSDGTHLRTLMRWLCNQFEMYFMQEHHNTMNTLWTWVVHWIPRHKFIPTNKVIRSKTLLADTCAWYHSVVLFHTTAKQHCTNTILSFFVSCLILYTHTHTHTHTFSLFATSGHCVCKWIQNSFTFQCSFCWSNPRMGPFGIIWLFGVALDSSACATFTSCF